MLAKTPLIPTRRKRGFTLVELLVTIGIVALLSITALTGLVKTQDQFAFRGAVKSSTSMIREIRSYALGNKTVPGDIVPYRYGALIDVTGNKIVIFADMPTPAENRGVYNAPGDPDPDYVFKTYDLPERYKFRTYNEKVENPDDQLILFYEPTNAHYFPSSDTAGLFDGRFIAIEVYDTEKPDRTNFIIIFQLAGNPETFDSLDDLDDM